MATAVLQIIKEFAGRQGLPVPTAILGSTDAGVIQMMRVLEERDFPVRELVRLERPRAARSRYLQL